ncbi:hypothetical protein Micbo1qcDRAFT_1616 [Microdochium bolleyi]|uniref:Required for respiratory growth protein 9, mitochondrial n=1 Tax=Microdochium bolleyi TaxID=196109 RepID=A0A136JHE7_9PEZI|nr:hypothetical protein Micbo1qcDRAFT_1616 [Microdochium bolleyi]
MSCSCRTSTLGVFVRSLTGLRLANTSNTRIIPGFAIQTTRTRLQSLQTVSTRTRQFSSTLLRARDHDEATAPAQSQHTDAQPAAPVNTESEQAISSEALDRGLAEGAILDLSPESISALAESTPQYAERKRIPRRFRDDGPPGKTYGGGNSGGQLHRRKILPKERKNQHIPVEHLRTEREGWQIQKSALTEKFPEGWTPRKRLSPDALDGIRALHTEYPEEYTTEVLARKFEVSAEAIRRILKSKWQPTTDEDIDRQERWFKRGKRIWGHMAELGKKPPQRWRKEGVVRDPSWNEKRSGPRTEYPYMPRRPADEYYEDENESAHKKLGDNLV